MIQMPFGMIRGPVSKKKIWLQNCIDDTRKLVKANMKKMNT
jgi:hypothetical protein